MTVPECGEGPRRGKEEAGGTIIWGLSGRWVDWLSVSPHSCSCGVVFMEEVSLFWDTHVELSRGSRVILCAACCETSWDEYKYISYPFLIFWCRTKMCAHTYVCVYMHGYTEAESKQLWQNRDSKPKWSRIRAFVCMLSTSCVCFRLFCEFGSFQKWLWGKTGYKVLFSFSCWRYFGSTDGVFKILYRTSCFFFKFFKIYFEREKENRVEETEGERESQAGSELSAWTLMRGSNPQTGRPWLELKSDAQVTLPPRCPSVYVFLRHRDRVRMGEGQRDRETWNP